jgi:hypothetical protein
MPGLGRVRSGSPRGGSGNLRADLVLRAFPGEVGTDSLQTMRPLANSDSVKRNSLEPDGCSAVAAASPRPSQGRPNSSRGKFHRNLGLIGSVRWRQGNDLAVSRTGGMRVPWLLRHPPLDFQSHDQRVGCQHDVEAAAAIRRGHEQPPDCEPVPSISTARGQVIKQRRRRIAQRPHRPHGARLWRYVIC